MDKQDRVLLFRGNSVKTILPKTLEEALIELNNSGAGLPFYIIYTDSQEEASYLKGYSLINGIKTPTIQVVHGVTTLDLLYPVNRYRLRGSRRLIKESTLIRLIDDLFKAVCLGSSFNRFETIWGERDRVIANLEDLPKYLQSQEDNNAYVEILHYLRIKTRILDNLS